jgi:hypothetical protein
MKSSTLTTTGDPGAENCAAAEDFSGDSLIVFAAQGMQ